MNTQRLLKLASFLRKLPPERFDFGTVVEHETKCGTIGCAIGWTPAVFPELVEWKPRSMRDGLKMTDCKNSDWYEEIAIKLFDIPRDDAVDLFTPNHQFFSDTPMEIGNDATPSQVADLIEEYIKLKS